MHMFRAQEAIHILLTMASLCAVLIVGVMASYPSAQDKTSPLVVRVATFAVEQGRLDDYRDGTVFLRRVFPAVGQRETDIFGGL